MTAIEFCLLAAGNISGTRNYGSGTILFWSAFLLLLLAGILLFIQVSRNRKNGRKISKMLAEISDLEDNAQQLHAQNDWLITEMHHRVKNNLQILTSLINSQLSFIKDKTGRDALSNSKHRLYALSLVHQRLFQNAMDNCIELSCCVKDLVDYLRDEFSSNDRVTFELDLMPLKADVSFAIPFELIINELLTNSLKFAFPGDQKGKVQIALHTEDQVNYELIYADNGIGLPDDIDMLSARSLGRSLIMGLSRQIKAKVTVDNNNGLMIRMSFNAPEEVNGHFGIC